MRRAARAIGLMLTLVGLSALAGAGFVFRAIEGDE